MDLVDDGNTTETVGAPVEGGLSLLVIGDGFHATYPLPPRGQVLIGRARDAQVVIDLPSISRRHARLDIDGTIRITDLGSANGTRVGGVPLEADQTVVVAANQQLELGDALMIIQRRAAAPARRVWTHEYFEARVEEECARANSRAARPFAVVRVRVAPGGPEGRGLIAAILEATRVEDVIAQYGPRDYELLVSDVDAPAVDKMMSRLDAALSRLGIRSRHAVAFHPRDGRVASALMAAAADGVAERPTAGRPAEPLLVDHPVMRPLLGVIERVARGTINVLLMGETGVGKEIFAERIHRLSARAGKPLVKINCAALSEQLLESELFGYEKGAFTGADRAKPGLLETADGGTVFFDEVADLPPAIQAKLLRVLEDRRIQRLGALSGRAVDVRLIAACNRDLAAEVARGAFREDLRYRLEGVPIVIPPLRERVPEIGPMARFFLAQAAAQTGMPAPELSPEALAMLERHHWPGNVRQLRNVIERAVLLHDCRVLLPEHLALDGMSRTVPSAPAGDVPPAADGDGGALDLRAARQEHECARIVEALQAAGGNQTKAAKLLGIGRRTLITKMELYGLDRPRKR